MAKRLMKIAEFREKHFEEGSRPAIKTIRSWIDNGDIPGERVGGGYYVDLSRWDKRSNNELVNKVLAA